MIYFLRQNIQGENFLVFTLLQMFMMNSLLAIGILLKEAATMKGLS